jgi:protein-tyrosine phosphatase
MIDLHCHILHDIDDGPETLEASLGMARMAVEDGITIVAATPHGRSSSSVSRRYSVDRLHTRLNELRSALAQERLPLKLIAGTEIFFEGDLPERLKAGELLTYGTSQTVLIEFPGNILPAALEQGIFAVQLAGYRVLVAHPERIKAVQKDPNVLIPLIERGALMQLTADALLGSQGDKMQQLCETLLTHGMAHVLASDAHGPHVQRLLQLSSAHQRATELLGKKAADTLVRQTPAALLVDRMPELPEPQWVEARRWFW